MESSPTDSRSWFLYLIECRDRRIYTGITNDLIRRFTAHFKGKGSLFTRANRPVRFIGCKPYPNRSIAAQAEAAMKRCDKKYKLAWADSNPVPEDVRSATLSLLQTHIR